MSVPTAQAEWALRRLTVRTADYLNMTQTPATVGRHLPDRFATRDANALVDLVAAAEAFCVARLATVGITAEVTTWDKRAKAWLKQGVDLVKDYPGWHAFMGFVEVRNAIQHGLGRLTDRQLGKHKQETLRYIASAGIGLNGDAIIIGRDDVIRCDHACSTFIRWLDRAARPAT